MGETSIDEDTFNEYIAEIKEHYTADKVSGNLVSYPPHGIHFFLPVPPIRSVSLVYKVHTELEHHRGLSTDFNCNSFTNDCIGFLTGGSIPDYIKGTRLPLPLFVLLR
jgi:hypothetical protein